MFDNICKFLAENFRDDLVTWLLGNPIKLTELKPTELSIEPIRADSLILLQSDDLVLHTEFQTGADETMPFRMLDYRVRVYRRYPNKKMRQVVIYLRPTNSPLVQQNSFQLEETSHRFELIRLWEIPPDNFLKYQGLLPFAVLTQTNDPKIVLNQVAGAIDEIMDRNTKSNLTAASAILANLVMEKNIINTILRSDIMQESAIYQEIYHSGELKGKLAGKQEEKERVALSLLRQGISFDVIANATELPLKTIEILQKVVTQNDN
ncbi:MAG: Rpn family recombination-promoting nuclease/putative transposase [Cyanobacterium sp. T60_A2020_053]|nr:Rpn family recombination-promoting nuclease/putative transposase [Cyanobacterium sp. T60_A2020_053]